jgi:putative two-component system response regulator
MAPPPPRVLIADDDVSGLLVLRRLLRDTPYIVDAVRSASQALQAFAQHEYAAVVADDERLPDMPGASLLAEVERLQRSALRILLARQERFPALAQGAQDARYQLIARPFFAKPLVTSLTQHAVRWQSQSAPNREDTQRTVVPVFPSEPEPKKPEQPDGPTAPVPGRIGYRRVLLTLAELAEAKSGHASGHGARVSALAAVLAQEAGLAGEALESVEDAALVHDVGELSLDPSLLQQRRVLTDAERFGVRYHVTSSWQIVRRAGLPPAALEAVRLHHERWDGAGHPDGVAGEAIPIGARIIAVADTWDALATDRPYRRAVALDHCVAEFEELAGTQLDPQLVRHYLDKKIYELIDWSDPPRPGVKLL